MITMPLETLSNRDNKYLGIPMKLTFVDLSQYSLNNVSTLITHFSCFGLHSFDYFVIVFLSVILVVLIPLLRD